MEYRLKKDFLHIKKGAEVVVSDVDTERSSKTVVWYNVLDEYNCHYKLGNTLTMNVDDWIEEVEEPKRGKVFIDGKFVGYGYVCKELHFQGGIRIETKKEPREWNAVVVDDQYLVADLITNSRDRKTERIRVREI